MVATELEPEDPQPQPEPQPVPPPDEKVVIKNPMDAIMARFDLMDKRMEQLATVTVKIAERVYDGGSNPPGTAPAGQNGWGFGDILKLIGQFIQPESSPMDALYMDVGQKVVGKTLDSTISRIVKNIGGDAAHHVVG